MSIDIVNTKPLLKDWIKTRLGSPTIHLEVEDAQIEQCIDDSVKHFTKYSGDATFRTALVLMLSAGETEYQLDEKVEKVVDLVTGQTVGGGINTLFTPTNQMYNAGMLDVFTLTGDLTSYYTGMHYLEMTKNMITAEYFLEFDKYQNKLIIAPPPFEDIGGILEVYSKRDFAGLSISTVYDEFWVKEYALALTKIIWGSIISKYSGVPLPGGGELNGTEIKSEGREDKKDLEENLMLDEGEPLEIWQG